MKDNDHVEFISGIQDWFGFINTNNSSQSNSVWNDNHLISHLIKATI